MRTRSSRAGALGDLLPIGIPAAFVADVLDRHASPALALSRLSSLLAEYREATGYTFDWGHVIVNDALPFTVWRIVPIRLRERLRARRPGAKLGIVDLLPLGAAIVRAVVRPLLPPGLELGGLHREGRRNEHALFALVLVDPAGRRRASRWIERRFVPELMPALLARMELSLEELAESQATASRG
jgi:hypothetical protein